MSENFGTDTSKYLNVVYGNGDVAGTMYVYLKIEPAFVPAGTSETSDHTVSVTVHGGPTWVSPTKPDGQDKDESDGVLDLTDYSDAKMVHLGNLGIAQVTKVNFPKNDNGKENWVPLGRFNFNDFLSMNMDLLKIDLEMRIVRCDDDQDHVGYRAESVSDLVEGFQISLLDNDFCASQEAMKN